MEIQITMRLVYGIPRIYPVCPIAKILTRLTGFETLSEYHLSLIKDLGYKITQTIDPKLKIKVQQ